MGWIEMLRASIFNYYAHLELLNHSPKHSKCDVCSQESRFSIWPFDRNMGWYPTEGVAFNSGYKHEDTKNFCKTHLLTNEDVQKSLVAEDKVVYRYNKSGWVHESDICKYYLNKKHRNRATRPKCERPDCVKKGGSSNLKIRW